MIPYEMSWCTTFTFIASREQFLKYQCMPQGQWITYVKSKPLKVVNSWVEMAEATGLSCTAFPTFLYVPSRLKKKIRELERCTASKTLDRQAWGPKFNPPEPMWKQLGMAHACNPIAGEAEAGGSLRHSAQPHTSFRLSERLYLKH